MLSVVFFFFNDTATTEIYTLSLHDALPISAYVFQIYILIDLDFRVGSILFTSVSRITGPHHTLVPHHLFHPPPPPRDRKSTRLNSSHANISYAVFCLKKKILHSDRNCT